jgi:hypothetical protein
MSSSFEEQFATALVAKMAGMTLKEVDNSTVQQSSSGPATRLDPTSFLTAVHEKKKQEQQRQREELDRMAEQMYPLPSPIQSLPPEPLSQQFIPQATQIPQQVTSVASSEIVDILKSIDSSIKEFVEVFKITKNFQK